MAAEELITNPGRISTILSDMNHRLLVVNVRLDPDGPLFASSLIRLDGEQRTLFLDELHPEEGHQQVGQAHEIRVYGNLRGIAIRFSTRVADILEEDGIALYACPYPEALNYLQRREIFRAALPFGEIRHVRLHHVNSSDTLNGRLLDLSAKGFCLEVDWSDIARVEPGTLLHYSGMQLPVLNAPLTGEAVLINSRPVAEPGRFAAGFRIVNLDQGTERALMRATLHYQREARKVAV
ncbi:MULTISPECIES: flagellar brake protein [Marichromatium]|uniref:C-di-GMP-binding flagellar brake protein YcgR n=1 Tax=Marichromatium gracile TaxID=1048 RepID=A0A4V6P4P2_MARGR|nr:MULTISPECIES: flagellar brake protein [Marichromatium]MBO8086806.1 flagellar brake protein [Marichromatium sp.]MBK1708140.1 hypothetical protein [Marichromatium gracile]RNE89624.1 flagellar brake protein [Marichromatium sp. AB31]RNE94703.1 flagellar brake protein [Marichromatium sp. AB32]TCW33437.1 c-di-GMP-binding flagellar brake protein YcgR [Marichromatium gracile]